VHFAAGGAVQIQKFLPAYQWVLERRVQIAVLFVGVLLPLVVIGEIAEDVWEGEPLDFDRPIQLWARGLTSPTLDTIMVWVSYLGSPVVVSLICLLVILPLVLGNRRRDAAFFLLAVVGAGLLNLIAKVIFARVRPNLWVSIDPRTDFSFPSGHSMITMALAATLLVMLWRTPWRVPVAVIGGIAVVLVGFSRIYLGVHYPSDVLCGWMASLVWVVGLDRIRRFRSTWKGGGTRGANSGKDTDEQSSFTALRGASGRGTDVHGRS
jgi:undecaprenyl-diphosphatase